MKALFAALLAVLPVLARGVDPLPIHTPNLDVTLGRAFAVDGYHGGLDFGLALEVPTDYLDVGVAFNRIQEIPTGRVKTAPLERYTGFEAFLAPKIQNAMILLKPGLGIDYLQGKVRNEYRYSEFECDGITFLGSCSGEEIEVRHHGSNDFAGLMIDPFLQLKIQLKEDFGVGLTWRTFISEGQGLGSISMMIYFGSDLRAPVPGRDR